jgi:uncharacterized membrane protein
MNKKTLNTILNIAGIMLGIAGLILILFSIFTEKDTLKWGMLCVALGCILNFIRIMWNKKTDKQTGGRWN